MKGKLLQPAVGARIIGLNGELHSRDLWDCTAGLPRAKFVPVSTNRRSLSVTAITGAWVGFKPRCICATVGA